MEAEDKKHWYHTRQIMWTQVQGYADPKKMPKSVEEWLPLESKPKRIRKPTQKFLQEAKAKLEARLSKL